MANKLIFAIALLHFLFAPDIPHPPVSRWSCLIHSLVDVRPPPMPPQRPQPQPQPSSAMYNYRGFEEDRRYGWCIRSSHCDKHCKRRGRLGGECKLRGLLNRTCWCLFYQGLLPHEHED